MADVTYTYKATEKAPSQGLAGGKGDGPKVNALVSAIELAPSTAGTRVRFGTVPSNARLLGASKVYWDDLATTGSPTLDMGLGSVNGNITSATTTLSTGHAISSADANGEPLLDDIADVGKFAWEIAGESSDPGGLIDVYGTVLDAPTTQTGTVAVETYYKLD